MMDPSWTSAHAKTALKANVNNATTTANTTNGGNNGTNDGTTIISKTPLEIANDRLANMIGTCKSPTGSASSSGGSSEETFAAVEIGMRGHGQLPDMKVTGGGAPDVDGEFGEMIVGGENKNGSGNDGKMPTMAMPGRVAGGGAWGESPLGTPSIDQPWGDWRPLFLASASASSGNVGNGGAATAPGRAPSGLRHSSGSDDTDEGTGPENAVAVVGMRGGGADPAVVEVGSGAGAGAAGGEEAPTDYSHGANMMEDWSAEAIVQGPRVMVTSPSYAMTTTTTTNTDTATMGQSAVGDYYTDTQVGSAAVEDSEVSSPIAVGKHHHHHHQQQQQQHYNSGHSQAAQSSVDHTSVAEGSGAGTVFPQEIEREVLAQVLGPAVLDELSRIGVVSTPSPKTVLGGDGGDDEGEGLDVEQRIVRDIGSGGGEHRSLRRMASSSHHSLADTVRSLRREPRDINGSIRSPSPALSRAVTPLPPHPEDEDEEGEEEYDDGVDGVSIHEDVDEADATLDDYPSPSRSHHVSVFIEDVETAGVGGRNTPSIFGSRGLRWRRKKRDVVEDGDGDDGIFVERGREGKGLRRGIKKVKKALKKMATKGFRKFMGESGREKGVVEDHGEGLEEEEHDVGRDMIEPTVTRLSVIPELNESLEELNTPAAAPPQPVIPQVVQPPVTNYYRGRSQNVHGPRPLILPATVQQVSPPQQKSIVPSTNNTVTSNASSTGRVVVTLEPDVARYLRDLAFQREGSGGYAIREQASFVAEQLREMFSGQVVEVEDDEHISTEKGKRRVVSIHAPPAPHLNGRGGPSSSFGANTGAPGRELPEEWYRYGDHNQQSPTSTSPDSQFDPEPRTPPPQATTFTFTSPATSRSGNYSLQLTLSASPIDHLSPTSSGHNVPIPSISSSSSVSTDVLLREELYAIPLPSFTPYPEKLAREIKRGNCFGGFGMVRPTPSGEAEWLREWRVCRVMWERGLALEMDVETPEFADEDGAGEERRNADWWAGVRERVEEIQRGGWGVERCVSCLCDDGMEVVNGNTGGTVGTSWEVEGEDLDEGNGFRERDRNDRDIDAATRRRRRESSARAAAKAAWEASRWFSFGESWAERYPDSEASSDEEGF